MPAPFLLKRIKIIFFSWLVLLCIPPAQSYAFNNGGDQLTEPERWVLSQLAQGKPADLNQGFTDAPEKHRLRAGFLEKLLTNGFSSAPLPRQGIQIAHAVINGPLNLEYVEINPLLHLQDCTFLEAVTFKESHFKKDLSIANCKFLKPANFKGTKIDGSVFCNHTIFEAESVWRDAKISKELHADGAEFRSPGAKADFCGIEVGTSAFFKSAKFHGPVLFDLIHIGREFDADKAEFFSETETANFNSMKVDQHALFTSTRFHGPVDFVLARVGLQFCLDKAEFLSLEKVADFRNLKVGGTIFFRDAKFHGPVKFELADIGLNLRATGIKFLNQCQPQDFSKIKVGHKIFWDGAIVCCNLDLSYGDFYDLEITGTETGGKEGATTSVDLPTLNLRGTVVQRDLKIAHARIGELNASHLQVKGTMQFNQVEILTSADFRRSAFQTLAFNGVKLPQVDKKTHVYKVYLADLTYNSLSIDKPDSADYSAKDYRALRNLVETSPFNTQAYVQLEAFLKRIGRDKWANEVFIRMHDRDLAEKYPWWSVRRWLEWFFWGKLAGYGRAPFRVFFVSLSLIGLGALLFDPCRLKVGGPTDGKVYKSVAIRFLISLDRFLPIDLGLVKYWNSKGSHFLIWLYFHLEQILGWILIPIALASIYSQIK